MMHRVATPMVLCLSTILSACAPISGGGNSAFERTLQYIRLNGFPSLADLIPGLPRQFADVEGVETDEVGKPTIPTASASLGFGADLDKLAAEAQALSVQGFSEARRIEAALQNFASPVVNMLTKAELFSGLGGAVIGTEGQLLVESSDLPLESASQIFDQLIQTARFAIATGGKNGLPEYLVLGVAPGDAGIEIGGLFLDQSTDSTMYETGFHTRLNFDPEGALKIELSFKPTMLTGLINSWSSDSCGDDLWTFSAVASQGSESSDNQLTISSQECPESRNSVSSISFGQDSSQRWNLHASFAQNFAEATSDSLRAFLGDRQGFVLQASASQKLDKVAAAAAVLKESDFDNATQEMIDRFGIGQLMADFFTAKYWQPKRDAAKEGSIFTNYDNISYWACDNMLVSGSVKSEVSSARELCEGDSVDVEDGLSFLTSLKKNMAQTSLVPKDVSESVNGLIDVLSFRNSIFVGKDSEVNYKKAPEESFEELDQSRKSSAGGLSAISSLGWRESVSANFQKIPPTEIPEVGFTTITNSISGFFKEQCNTLSGDSAERAGRNAEAAKAKCG
jgi:hypothetical protein